MITIGKIQGMLSAAPAAQPNASVWAGPVDSYRRPDAPEIQAIRGKDPSAALKGLLDKKIVRCLGRKKVVGNPLLYATSTAFLMHFGLNSLDDLPSIEEFDEFVDVLEQKQASLYADEGEPPEPVEGQVEPAESEMPAAALEQTATPEVREDA